MEFVALESVYQAELEQEEVSEVIVPLFSTWFTAHQHQELCLKAVSTFADHITQYSYSFHNYKNKSFYLINLDGRFTAQGRVSAAVHDNGLQDSPSRLNPNRVLLREREGGADQQQEAAYRRENYALFKKNLEEAFDEYNVNKDQYLSRQEFKNFMIAKSKVTQ